MKERETCRREEKRLRKFLEAAGVRQAKAETEVKSLIKASSGGQHRVAQGT